jgi:hypothetical protein
MHSARRLLFCANDNRRLFIRALTAAAASTSSLAALALCDEAYLAKLASPLFQNGPCRCTAACEDQRKKKSKPQNSIATGRPLWIRRTLAWLRLASLPLPRLLVKGDPAFVMDTRLLQRRQEDEVKMQNLVRGAIAAQERNPKALQDLNDQCLELAYGEGVTMKIRQDFVHVSFPKERRASVCGEASNS